MPDYIHQFSNGLTLLAEPMEWLESAAFALLVPAGCAGEPQAMAGLAGFTCEMVQRGSGSRDSRQFISELELLGADCTASVTNSHTSFGGAMPAENLRQTLAIYADAVRRPQLPPEQLEDARLVCIQEVRSIEDEPAQRTLMELRRRHYPDPFGRSSPGCEETLRHIGAADVRAFWQRAYTPQGAILSVAGKIDWQRLRDEVGALFGDWTNGVPVPLPESTAARGYRFIEEPSAQTHIGIAYPSVHYAHPDYYVARAAIGVLSDGMSSRLFTEVREKRGLCYTVYAILHSLRDRGSVLCYAGTTTDRAQETLDVILEELDKLTRGIQPDELERLKSRIKSTLIMQQESSPSRSGSLAGDWYFLGRVQPLDELRRIIDALDCDQINAYLAQHPPGDYTIVTLGAKPLEVPGGVS